jgi:hypothetical protein
MSSRDYSLKEILDAFAEAFGSELHIAMPGRVVSYNKDAQTAVVEPVCKLPRLALDGSITYLTLPTFPDVKVTWPSGGGFVVAIGLAKGDPVSLIFSQVALGEYLDNGEDASPLDTRRHSLGYPSAIPGGWRPDTQNIKDAPATGVTIGKDDADQQIHISDTDISLGKGATDFAALASLVKSELQAIKAKFDTHTHGGVTTGAGASGPPAVPLDAIGDVKATLVKVK